MDMMTEWETPTTVSTEQLDEAVRKLIEYDKDYEAKKKISNEANEKYETQRSYVLNLLQTTGKLNIMSMALELYQWQLRLKSHSKDPVSKRQMIDYFLNLDEDLYPAYLSR
jgi:hypothetical protein